ncbi:MAG: TlpA family protein disulfide reductase [Polyangiaceae bacterium]
MRARLAVVGRWVRKCGWPWSGLVVACALVWSGCVPDSPAPQPVFASAGRSGPVHFRYPIIDGRSYLGSDSLRGRPTVLGFLTTYDMASQAQARFLNAIVQRHAGRVQVAAIVLESAENRPLIIAFRDGLDLGYPMAIGDPDIIKGEGPFGDVQTVPATIVLDASLRVVWKKTGIVREEEIEKVLREL